MFVDVTATALRACGRGGERSFCCCVNRVPTFIDVGIVHPSAKSYRTE